MTDREAMRQALEALEASIDVPCYYGHPKQEAAAEALRARLEQPEPEQEPVAHCKLIKTNGIFSKAEVTWIGDKLPVEGPLYTHPPQRKPLTEEEIWEIHDHCIPPTEGYVSPVDFARAVEAARNIKGEA